MAPVHGPRSCYDTQFHDSGIFGTIKGAQPVDLRRVNHVTPASSLYDQDGIFKV